MRAGSPYVFRCWRWAGRMAAIAASASLLLLAIEAAPAGAETPSSQPPKPRILFVDADHPATWPKGLEPISAGELRKLLDAVQSSGLDLECVQIEQATYSATFHDGAFRDGNAELMLGKVKRPCLVSLEHPNLDFSRLQWAGGPSGKDGSLSRDDVLYGIDRVGRRVVIAQPGHRRLSCAWTLAGHPSLGATEFGLSLPPAVVSEIKLRLPSELSLECDQGVFSRIGPEPDGKSALWRIELGSRSTCRLRIIAPGSLGNGRTFYDQDTTYVVAADRLRVQSKLQIETFGAPLRTLRLGVPAGVRLETVSYGDDFPLVLPATSSDKDRAISLDLPEPVSGKGRTIIVEASTSTVTNRVWNLPQIDLQGAQLREGPSQLTIRAPLKLVRFGGNVGLTQSEAPTYSIDGEETFVFRRNASDPPLQIEIREPAPALATRTLGRLALRRDRCLFAADVVCSANGGSTFSVAFELPESWDVTRVEAVGDVSRMIDETTRPTPEHRKRVKIDFFRAVTDREPKRFRVEATRSLPRSGETMDLPVMEFPGFASQEVETLVVYSAPIELTLNPAEAFAAFDPAAILSVLPDSPLRPDRSAAADAHLLVHRWTAQSAKGQITLRHGDDGVQAKVQSAVEVGASQISERFDATIVPSSPLDRLFVYLSTEVSSPSWQLVTNRSRALEGALVAATRHAEWNLPDGGQLWEIQFPEPVRHEFHLHGTWRTSLVGATKVALPMIAGARNFDGQVELNQRNSQKPEVEALGPRPVEARRGGMQRFRYDRPADVLVVRPRASGVTPAEARFASLRLTSYLNAGGQDEIHRADFSIAPLLTSEPFRFQLEGASRLCSVAVNGAPVRIERRGDEVIVPALPADAWNRVQVEYKTNVAVGLFRENRPIDVPRPQARVLAFRWRVLLAPGLRPGASPVGLPFDRPSPGLSWPERIFGPLGQSRTQMRLPFFKPDPWIVDAAEPDTTDDWIPEDPRLPAAGWKMWQASAQEIPAKITLTIWHAGAIRTLAWIICLGSLTGWLAVVRLAPSLMHRCVPYALAAGAAFAFAAPAPYALFAGAVVSATLLAILLSRSWSTIIARRGTETPAHHQGSTITFEARTVGLLLVLVAFGTMAVFAQDAGPVGPGARQLQPRPVDNETRRSQRSSPEDLLVVIPVHPNHSHREQPAALPVDRELVYLAPTAIDSLRRRAATISRNEGVVFLSSDYRIALDQRQPARIEATYQIAVIGSAAQQVWLPLSNATLAGADACHVDGTAFPIRQEDGGFILSLKMGKASDAGTPTPAAESPSESRRPITAERPQATSKLEQQPRIYEIRLVCFPTSGATPARFEMQVPQTVHTAVRISHGSAWPVTIVEADEGKPSQLHPGDPAVDVGQTQHLRIKAGSGPTDVNSGVITARAVQFWRVSPGLVEMDCRVTYDREDRSIEKFTWLVPAGASIRASGEGYRAALRASKLTNGTNGRTAEGLVPLDFDCSAAPAGPLTLAARLLLPIGPVPSTPGDSFNVPLPRFASGEGDPTSLTVSSDQIGISAASGYRVIAATTEPNLSHTSKADPTFRQESFGARKEPDLIFDCQGISSLPVRLDAVVPTHKVRVTTHEARVSTDRIEWRTTAEIRTENAPAFVHVLNVDHRLKIDSVSVREDDVERLVRFSQSGDAVTLFLRDRAAATQDLVLTGHLPLEHGRPTKLPAVNLEHGVLSDVRLAISSDPDLDVVVADTPGVVRLKSKGNSDATTKPEVREYSIAPGDALPEIRVNRRSDAARSAQAPAGIASKTAQSPADNRKSLPNGPATRQPAAHTASALVTRLEPRVETVITLDVHSDGSVAGSTDVLLERFTEPTLKLSCPESFELRGTLLDGRPVQPLVADGQISLSVPSEPVVHRLALHWESRGSSPLKVLAHIREDLPVPLGTPADHVLISVSVPFTFHVWGPAQFTPVDSQTFARLRDDVQSAAGEAVRNDRTASQSIDGPSVANTEGRTIGRLAITASGATFSAWAIDTFWLRFPLAAAIFALIAVTAFQPYAVRAVNWLLSNPALTLAAIGVTWCFCLTPRAVGLFVLLASLGLLITDRRRSKSRAPVLPSTLHTPGALESR
jgi:hypothetical protein